MNVSTKYTGTHAVQVNEFTAHITQLHAQVAHSDDNYLFVRANLEPECGPSVVVEFAGTRQGEGTVRLPSLDAARDLVACLESVIARAEELYPSWQAKGGPTL